MRYLFDTNAIIIYLRDQVIKDELDRKYNPLSQENTAIISVVTLGEVESIALRNQWGLLKRQKIEKFLNQFVITDINARDVIKTYGEIDAYSQNKLVKKKLGMSSRNMGKNDLWIAATATVTSSTLISSDQDFMHLKKEYIDIIYIDVQERVIK